MASRGFYRNPRFLDRRATIFGIERKRINRRYVRDIRQIGERLYGLVRHKRQVFMVRQSQTSPHEWMRVEWDGVTKEWRGAYDAA